MDSPMLGGGTVQPAEGGPSVCTRNWGSLPPGDLAVVLLGQKRLGAGPKGSGWSPQVLFLTREGNQPNPQTYSTAG